ncbi:hypothetical protein ACIA8G_21185 [Lentzea sp. NPDC051213]|uniref:hypothetical protein n=1 Tax=Lentzea sp. NPDC051213 TaxID=3364126 RepID=UPI0037BAE71B
MNGGDPNGRLDELDAVVLGNVREMWQAIDPVPRDLLGLIDVALDLAGPGAEFLRASTRQELVAVRGGERAELITFDGATTTLMVNITANADGTVRIDGWLTPPVSRQVDLRMTTGTVSVTSDDGGRFAFDGVARGLAQLHVHVGGGVTTPSIVL